MLAAVVAAALWAHNDFEHPRPLHDALAAGACAVEADVHLQDGELRVAHRFWQTKPGRTLETLYLDPLKDAALPTCEPFVLAVDFKGKPEATLAALEKALAARPYLQGKVRVLVSGSIPKTLAASRAGALFAVDGRPSDIGKDPKIFPVVSAELPRLWPVLAPELVARAHASGHKIRFWAVREEPWAVRELEKLGVDYVCLDRLELYRLSSSAARAQ